MAKKIARKPVQKVSRDKLGAGIGAIFNKDIEEKIAANPEEVVKELSNTIAMIPVSNIEVNPNQPRNHFNEEALEELSESIKVHGLIQPLTVRRLNAEAYQLISGERRLRASKRAGLTEVPAYVRIANDQEMLEMALIENIQREDLNAMEIAVTYQRLMDECALTHDKLSERVGKKRSTVTHYVNLLSLPPDIQKAIRNKEISMGHGKELAGIKDFAVQSALFKKTLDENLSVRALERLKSEYSSPKPSNKAPKPKLPDDYQDVERTFREFFGSKKVQLKLKSAGKGQIIISFDKVTELNQFLDCLDQ